MNLQAFFACLVYASLALVSPGISGESVEETERCPFGNERVTYTSTYGCSSFGGTRRMSLAPVTSCDFIERLPQCSKTKLPLYRKFSKAEVKILKSFSKTEIYLEAAEISRFYLAYVIERELSPENKRAQLDLLLNGFWYDSGLTYQNETYFKAFAETINIFTKAAPQDEKDFFLAAAAYVLVQRGKLEKAREIIAAVRRSPAAKGTFLIDYVKLVEECLGKASAPECQPEYEVELKG